MRTLGILIVAVLSPLLANAATFGPEVAAASPEHFSAFGRQTANEVACNDDSCLALWSEWSTAREGLYSSVVDASGAVHPASSNVVSAGYAADATVVWTGDHYLATWFDVDQSAFLAATLSKDGRVSGAVRVLGTFAYSPGGNALAWNGRHAFAVFNTGGDAAAAVLDADANVTRKLTLPTGNAATLAVAASGQTFGVVWVESFQSTSTVKFQRYGDDGSRVDSEPVQLAENLPVEITKAGIAGNATQFGIAYTPFVDSSIDRVRIDASTGVIERLPVITFARQVSGVYWSGDDFVAYGPDAGTIETIRFSSNTVRVLGVSTASDVTHVRLAAASFGAAGIWGDSHLGPMSLHVFGALFDSDATAVVKGDLRISVSALPQATPALASSGDRALLAWAQRHDEAYADILVRRLNAAGAPIDDAPATLTSNVIAGPPTAVWLGNAWLVVWKEANDVVGKRVSASGAVLDANAIQFGHGNDPRLVTNGSVTILVFWDSNGISFLQLSANGEPIDGHPVTITSHSVISFSAATNGSEFLVAWDELTPRPTIPRAELQHIYAARLTATAQLIDTAPIAIATGLHDAFNPAIASDGRDFLIVYSNPGISTKRLLEAGSLAGSTPEDDGVVVDATEGYLPAAAWNGSGYVIVWNSPDTQGWTAVATTVDQIGASIDTPRALGRTESPFFAVTPAAATVRDGVVVAYSRGDAADDGIPRVFTRQVLSGSPRGRGVRH